MQRILGLDFGEKRMGVAITDPLQITSQPLTTIIYFNNNELWQKLDEVFNQYEIEQVVVGLPLNMNGSHGPISHKAEAFARKVEDRYRVNVDLWDERLSSASAEKTLRDMGKKPSRCKEKIDKVAAALILQGYLGRIEKY